MLILELNWRSRTDAFRENSLRMACITILASSLINVQPKFLEGGLSIINSLAGLTIRFAGYQDCVGVGGYPMPWLRIETPPELTESEVESIKAKQKLTRKTSWPMTLKINKNGINDVLLFKTNLVI